MDISDSITFTDNKYIFLCPHCETLIEVSKNQTNCNIFRHGVFKHNFQQIDPHMEKQICNYLVEKDLIYGCGKPFKIDLNQMKVSICDYI